MKKVIVLITIFIPLTLVTIYSCNNKQAEEIKEGEELARISCASCHAFPDPSLLDKKTWGTSVLPIMAEQLNVEGYSNPYNASGPAGDMPSLRQTPGNSFAYEKWEKIVKYYVATAPEKIPDRSTDLGPIETGLKNFDYHSLYNNINHPVTTLVYFDTTHKKIFIGDGNAEKVFVTDPSLRVIDSLYTGTGATDIHFPGSTTTAITMGILKPSDALLGKLEQLSINKKPVTIIDSLQRPVQATYADLNDDGKTDIVISEFGFRRGGLSWFENKGSGKYEKHVLKALPGATRTEIFDLNNDKKPDIVALMAQGDEGVFIFYNEGNGKFKEERVIQFPPSYGSNYFQLFDFNGDGYMDIITTSGDNGDYSIILKPYHGIRIFYNDGQNKFEEKAFLPVYGVQKAIPADFDNDGDIDIASIAFFPDYERLPQESFIYWENSGNNIYKRYTFNGFDSGRWITMDVGDIDQDGDKDIILGNAFFTLGIVPKTIIDKWQSNPISVVLLENTLIKKIK